MNEVKNYEDEPKYDTKVINQNWKGLIRSAYTYNEPIFHRTIWEMSQTAFDKPREIQVVVDDNDVLFISVGSPGFVSFDDQEDDEEELYGEDKPKMRIPLKQWIHTHPFGKAFWSSTDMRTLVTWEPILASATVLGHNEKQRITFRADANGRHFNEFIQTDWGDEEE